MYVLCKNRLSAINCILILVMFVSSCAGRQNLSQDTQSIEPILLQEEWETSLGETGLGETNLGETSPRETSLGEASLGEKSLGETSLGESQTGEFFQQESLASQAEDIQMQDQIALAPRRESLEESRRSPNIEAPPETTSFRSGRKKHIGFLLPLSGVHAEFGKTLYLAAEMALFDANKDDVEFIFFDTKSEPRKALEAYKKASIRNDIKTIFGPVRNDSLALIAAEARKDRDKISVYAFSTNHQLAGDNVHILGENPTDEVLRIINYAVAHGITEFVLLAPDSNYGKTVIGSATKAIKEYEVDLIAAVFYRRNQKGYIEVEATTHIIKQISDYNRRHKLLEDYINFLKKIEVFATEEDYFKEEIARLENLDSLGAPPFQAILLATGGQELVILSSLLAYYDSGRGKARLLGTSLWQDEDLLNEPSLKGAWFAVPSKQEINDFDKKFKAIYKTKPSRLANILYDSALKAINSEIIDTKALMLSSDPINFFLPEKQMRLKNFDIIEITKYGFNIIDHGNK